MTAARRERLATARVAVGVALAIAGVVLVFSPSTVAQLLHRPPTTVGEHIDLRATWGGAVTGIGAFAIACRALRPVGRALATLLACTMSTIGAARLLGFAFDGAPDALQLGWLAAEVVLVAGALVYLSRRPRRAER